MDNEAPYHRRDGEVLQAGMLHNQLRAEKKTARCRAVAVVQVLKVLLQAVQGEQVSQPVVGTMAAIFGLSPSLIPDAETSPPPTPPTKRRHKQQKEASNTMQTRKLKNIAACPKCGKTPEMQRNTSKEFRIKCPKCGARTGWYTKPQAIINWYNMLLQLMKNELAKYERHE